MNFSVSGWFLQYTPAEVEWYGLSHFEAINKIKSQQDAEALSKIAPAKHALRKQLFEQLKATGLEKVEQIVKDEAGHIVEPTAYVDHFFIFLHLQLPPID